METRNNAIDLFGHRAATKKFFPQISAVFNAAIISPSGCLYIEICAPGDVLPEAWLKTLALKARLPGDKEPIRFRFCTLIERKGANYYVRTASKDGKVPVVNEHTEISLTAAKIFSACGTCVFDDKPLAATR